MVHGAYPALALAKPMSHTKEGECGVGEFKLGMG